MNKAVKKLYLKRTLSVLLMVFVTIFCLKMAGTLVRKKHYNTDEAGNIYFDPGFHPGHGIIEGLYHLPEDTLDVVYLGSSHSFCSISPLEIWKQQGITGYNVSTSAAKVWQSYYLLEEAFRTQHPKVVALEVLRLESQEPQQEAFNRESLDDMKWGKARIGLIRTSLRKNPDGEYALSYLFPVLRYHDRWNELSELDYGYFSQPGDNLPKGYVAILSSNTEHRYNYKAYETTEPDAELPQENKDWLDRIKALCEEHGASLILYYAPAVTITNPDRSLVISKYADERGIPFLDFNTDYELRQETGIDYYADIASDGGHMNLSGATKLSDYMGEYIAKNYGLTDKRQDPAYASWNTDYEEFQRVLEESSSAES